MQKPERCATHSSLFLPLAAVAVRAPGRTKSDQRGIPLAVYRQHPTKGYHNRQSMARASVQMDGGSFCCGFPFRLASRLPSPSQSAYASCATSPTGRGKSTPVGSGQAMVRQTCSRLRLTTLFAGIDGGTLGSPRGGAGERSETERAKRTFSFPQEKCAQKDALSRPAGRWYPVCIKQTHRR